MYAIYMYPVWYYTRFRVFYWFYTRCILVSARRHLMNQPPRRQVKKVELFYIYLVFISSSSHLLQFFLFIFSILSFNKVYPKLNSCEYWTKEKKRKTELMKKCQSKKKKRIYVFHVWQVNVFCRSCSNGLQSLRKCKKRAKRWNEKKCAYGVT